MANDYYKGSLGKKTGDFFIGLGIVVLFIIILTPQNFI
jgi:hypothetical protein